MRPYKNKKPPPPTDSIRCVIAPDGRVVADIFGKLPCPNPLYLGAYADVWQRAISHNLAQCWFGDTARFDESSLTQLRANLHQAITQTIALAHKSGGLILGREAVMAALELRDTECIILARDAGGADKKALLRNPVTARYCHIFGQREELGHIVGRRAQVYLCLCDGALSEKLTQYLTLHTRFTNDLTL